MQCFVCPVPCPEKQIYIRFCYLCRILESSASHISGHASQLLCVQSRAIAQTTTIVHNGNFEKISHTHTCNHAIDVISVVSQPLKDIAVVNGQTARFECIVQCDPHPDVEWFRDSAPLRNDSNHIIEFRNGVCRLTIPEASIRKRDLLRIRLEFLIILIFNYFR